MNDKRNQFEYAEKELDLHMRKALDELAKEEDKPKEIFSEIAELLSVEALKVCSNKYKLEDLNKDTESTEPHCTALVGTYSTQNGEPLGHEPYEKFAAMINAAAKQGKIIGSLENNPPFRLKLSKMFDAQENETQRYTFAFYCVSTVPQSTLKAKTKELFEDGDQ
jgi:hypothetical protein